MSTAFFLEILQCLVCGFLFYTKGGKEGAEAAMDVKNLIGYYCELCG